MLASLTCLLEMYRRQTTPTPVASHLEILMGAILMIYQHLIQVGSQIHHTQNIKSTMVEDTVVVMSWMSSGSWVWIILSHHHMS